MMMATSRSAVVVVLVLLCVWGWPASVAAHHERDVTMPDGTGRVPDYRTFGPEILVCKSDRDDFVRRVAEFPAALRSENLSLFDRCRATGVRHVQDAVRIALPGSRVRVLPGVYREEPSLAEASPKCAALARQQDETDEQVLSWEDQVDCPHAQNLIAVLGKSNLQIEGTGAGPGDVVIDAQYRKSNALRADRAPGIYLRNLTIERTTFNAVYIMETDGFVIDRVVARWNSGYGFLTFATDHGLYTDCEAYGNGEAGLYPGAASDINRRRGLTVDRYAIEIRRCSSHHNLLGYSGTAGNSVFVHDSEFAHNGAGIMMDSMFPSHPGLPQNHSRFEHNEIHDNNRDYYRYIRDRTCLKAPAERGYEHGVVCPVTSVPRGSGVIVAGGNFNLFADNWIYGQDYAGIVQFWVPAQIRDGGLRETFDTSHHNRYAGNHLGTAPDGARRANRLDVWWDGQGSDNRWQPARAQPYRLPAMTGPATNRIGGDPFTVLKLFQCRRFEPRSGRTPVGCDWYGARSYTRLEVLATAIQSGLFALAAMLLLVRRLPRRRLAYAATGAGVIGAATDVMGVVYDGTILAPVASGLLAAAWLAAGVLMYRQARHRRLAVLTAVLGGFALLQAVDRGLYVLPYMPMSFGWPILVLGLVLVATA